MFKVIFFSVLACFYGLRFNESPATDVGFVEDSLSRRRRRRKSDDDGAWDSSRANYIIKFGGTASSTDALKIKAFLAAMADVVAAAAFPRFEMYTALTNSQTEIALLVKANIDVKPFAAASLLEVDVRGEFFSVLVSWNENSNWATNAPVLPALWDQLFKVQEFRTVFNTKLTAAVVADASLAFSEYGIDKAVTPVAVERTYSFTQVEATVAVTLAYTDPPGAQFGLLTSTKIDSGEQEGAGAEEILLEDLKLGLQKAVQTDPVYLRIQSKIPAAKLCEYYFAFEFEATGNALSVNNAKATIGTKCARLISMKEFKAGFEKAAAKTFGVSPSHMLVKKFECTDPTALPTTAAPLEIIVHFKYEAPCASKTDGEPKMINDRMNKCVAGTCYPDKRTDNDGDNTGANADNGGETGSDADIKMTDDDIAETIGIQTEETKAIVANAKATYTLTTCDACGANTDITVVAWKSIPEIYTEDEDTGVTGGTAAKLTDGTAGPAATVYLVKYLVVARNDENSQVEGIVGDAMKKHIAGIAKDEGQGWSDFKTGMTASGQLKLRGIAVESCTAMGDTTLVTTQD